MEGLLQSLEALGLTQLVFVVAVEDHNMEWLGCCTVDWDW